MTLLSGVLLVIGVLLWPARSATAATVLDPEPLKPMAPPGNRLWAGRRAKRSTNQATAVLQVLEGIGPAVEAGVPPGQAVEMALLTGDSAITDAGLRRDLERLVEAGRAGDELGPIWTAIAHQHQLPAMVEVGRAWSLSERLGSPLAVALDTATQALRAHLDHQRQVRVLTAGPRATMQLLTLLPVAGVGLSSLIGVSPAQVYAGPVLLLAVLPGLGLLLTGRALVARMVRNATRERGIA